MLKHTLTITAATLLALPAPAQDRGPRADLDGDGAVTLAEFEQAARTRFDAMDTDFSGTIDDAERRAARDMRRDRMADRRFERTDTDGDGAISREEDAAARAQKDARREQMRERRLQRFDTDGDGRISDAEREAARASRLQRGDRPRMDADGDGLVTRAEHDAVTLALFGRMDANGDGVLTKGEGRRGKRKGKRRFGR